MIYTIGQFRHRVDIMNRVQTQNADGSITYTDEVYKTVWAYMEPKKGNKYLYGQQIDDYDTHIIIIRYMPELTTENWINYYLPALADPGLLTKIAYRITSVRDVYLLQRFTFLTCREEFETP